ncbi:Las1-like-domain-containing protein [Leptodontidium sp. 2 PMI_412]|nr:Las1-like-domain-containing protein [Leptodontidium sp. 2 PMI_412]
MVQYVITPWRNARDLLSVRENLYPNLTNPGRKVGDAERRHAVAKVSVWMQRGNCPHLVESTAILTAAVLNDVKGNATYCVRAAYAAAFCRFVTGLLDSHQTKNRKLSMYSIAKTIGLPATYVELRHQATHEELPSLSKLRTATQKALHWIWDYYWVKLPPAPPTRQEGCDAFMKKLFVERGAEDNAGLEEEMEKWDTDVLLNALWKVDEEGLDKRTREWVIDMQRRIVKKGRANSVESDGEVEPVGNIEDIRAELHQMEKVLDEQDDDMIGESVWMDTSPESKSWAMWEGPWMPKPIGIV